MNYLKIHFYSKIDGTFKGHGILVKSDDCFYVITKKTGDPMIPYITCGQQIAIGDVQITATGGVKKSIAICSADQYTGFDTALLMIRCGGNNIGRDLSSFRIVADNNVSLAHDVFTLNLDDLFIVEQRNETAASGILIKGAYTQNEIYSGYGSYHSNQHRHSFNTPIVADKPWRIGVELEVYARTLDAYNKITGARTNWFQCERDGSLDERSYPIEIKTIPLRACDATSVDFWAEPMDRLKQLAVSKGQRSTGLHVHIGKEIFGDNERVQQDNLSKLCLFYTYYVEDDPAAHRKNVTICGREFGYHCNTSTISSKKTEISEFAKEIGFSVVAQNPAAFMKAATDVKNNFSDRTDINVGNWNSYGTVEFRKGKGCIGKLRLAAICAWWEQMCLYTRNVNPRNWSFDDFFNGVCRDYPAVAHFFQNDEEA